jgi:GNAT superfamily N-acetyltransferase
MHDYIIAGTDEDYRNAAKLFKEYAAWLNIDLAFQHFEEELQELKTMYAAPDGGIVLCKNSNDYIACVAVRKISNDTAELKRMFVKQAYQGHGIGKILLEKAIELARSANYTCIRLDTLNHMLPAINLYKKYGFYEIPAYYNNPNTTAVYFELKF